MIDHTGETCGEFTVIRLHKIYPNGAKTWECVCKTCGGTKIIRESELIHNPYHSKKVCPPKREHYTKTNEKDYTKILGCRKSCRYWRSIDSGMGLKCCHYCVDNHERRPRKADGSCGGYDPTKYVRTQVPLVYGETQ